MKLTTRVSAYFLIALAVALMIYSSVFYTMTRRQIEHQFEHELRGVLNALVAAAEIEDTEVKWQPLEHNVSVGTLDEFGDVDWVVVGDQKLVVEKSSAADQQFVSTAMALAAAKQAGELTMVHNDSTVQQAILYQRVAAPRPMAIDRELDEFDELTVVVRRPLAKRNGILAKLLLLVTCLPMVAWLVAAALGGWMVRQALKPVATMSNQAQSIMGSDFESRLVVYDTGDELADLATTFNQLLDRQQAAFEQQRRFAGDAAHELRSPVTVLLGQIDVALRRPRSVDEYQATLQLLRNKTLSLQEIIESLLFLARSEGDTVGPALQSLPLAAWLDEYALSWANLDRAEDCSMENEIDAAVSVRATPSLLTRIVDNLVSNAIKYSTPGTPVKLRAINDAHQVEIRVIDSGNGISEIDQQHLFDPFFRSSDARIRGIAGSGLGLAIAARIARTLHGSLQVESAVGRGSCFTLILPVAE